MMNGLQTPLTPVSQEEEVEVGLASAGSRIAAALLNSLFNVLVYLPWLAALLLVGDDYETLAQGAGDTALDDSRVTGLLLGGSLLILVYGIAQIFYMSRDGQSLGKKIMGIRVLKSNGRNPGFLGTVLIREVVYSLLVVLVAVGISMLGMLLGLGGAADMLGNLVSYATYIACLVMLFRTQSDRRTLQDMLADTVVVKLPKR
ncbi:RDD family protein [Neisseria perflava]|uniref:RDD family protein n=1 Tax=Neisseria perflava TaxID=33053 RepID=UPI00209CFCA5|nr:RDD family protein [Neisseria perflava]MCP1660305.1 putative RDD family membrane protein YckC [Neisseria perflava]MCP1771532.1 putative RDD family membrane protein YckC [Neisseria perflava]